MHTLIDGYNLAHQITLPAGSVGPEVLDRARRELLRLLASRFGVRSAGITVVFDTKRWRRLEPETTFEGIDVRFAVGEEADDLIERIIQAHPNPRKLTVVSDDHRLQRAGKRAGCVVAGCQQFLDELERRPKTEPSIPPEKPDISASEELAEWEATFAVDRPSSDRPSRKRRRN